jgi:hypothetical protein
MNPDFLTDCDADFCFDSFNEAHANPAEFIGGPDRRGNFQRGLFYLAPAKMWSCVDAFERVGHFGCFHICFVGYVADSFNDATILSGALLPNCESGDRSPANIEQNRCSRRRLTQKRADFTQGDLADLQLRHRFHPMFAG